MTNALSHLLDSCRALPGECDREAVVRPRPDLSGETGAAPPRREMFLFLSALATRVEPQLVQALERAGRAWDQVDATVLLDAAAREAAARLARAWQATGGAEAALALLTLQSALALVTLIERRLATLVRLRLRGAEGELFVDGRPFLDLPRALAELARRWS